MSGGTKGIAILRACRPWKERLPKKGCVLTSLGPPRVQPRRSAGECASRRAIKSFVVCGNAEGVLYLPLTIFLYVSTGVSATKGGSPTSISYSKMPSVHQSTAQLWPWLERISGARYSGVPHSVHVRSLITFAKPKSTSFKYP